MRTSAGDDLRALAGPASWQGLGLVVRRSRDLILVDIDERTLVVATDSNASIGDKPADFLAQPAELTGYSAAKVPLMEVLAAGADPFLVVDSLGVELRPTGLAILRGIRHALEEVGLEGLTITGSDESNMPTRQTGVGVTVMGSVPCSRLRVGVSRPGDHVWLIGRRASGLPGDEYDPRGPDIAGPADVRDALGQDATREVLPVGSHGVRYECDELARSAGVRFEPSPGAVLDWETSAGASTCFIVAVHPGFSAPVVRPGLPATRLGVLAAP